MSENLSLLETILQKQLGVLHINSFLYSASDSFIHNELISDKSILVIILKSSDITCVKKLLRQILPFKPLKLIVESNLHIADLADLNVETTLFNEFMPDNSSEFSDLLTQTIYPLSEYFASTISHVFQGTTLESFSKIQSYAIYNWMRVSLIPHARRSHTIISIIENCPQTQVLITTGSGKDNDILKRVTELTSLHTDCYYLFSNSKYKLSKMLSDLNEADNRSFNYEFLERINVVQKWLVNYKLHQKYKQLSSLHIATNTNKLYVFVVRWSLKTVPLTILPILHDVPNNCDCIVINADKDKSHEALLKDLAVVNLTRTANPIQAICTSEIRCEARNKRSTKNLAKVLKSLYFSYSSTTHQVPYLIKILNKLTDDFFEDPLWRLVNLELFFNTLFNTNQKVILAVSPGRHTEALIAQDSARRFNKVSIDIQNAYMSSGYTYTKPYGDYVTAIDQWSEDLFVNHFNINKSKIIKVGTPRFDELAKLNKNSQLPTLNLGFTSNKLLVCFAVQPGDFENNQKIIKLIAESNPHSGPFNALIKLHPRESDDVLQSYKSVITSLKTKNEFLVTRDIPIIDIISHSFIVITIFSNVGIEAAILDKHVLIANLKNESLPLPLDEFNIGYNAYSENDFRVGLDLLLSDSETQKNQSLLRKKYFENNPHFLLGNSKIKILEFLAENIA